MPVRHATPTPVPRFARGTNFGINYGSTRSASCARCQLHGSYPRAGSSSKERGCAVPQDDDEPLMWTIGNRGCAETPASHMLTIIQSTRKDWVEN